MWVRSGGGEIAAVGFDPFGYVQGRLFASLRVTKRESVF